MTVRTVLVTGSSSGIGRAVTERLLSQGCVVIGVGRDHTRHPLEHPDYHPFTIDLSDISGVTKRLNELWSAHPDIDAVISNAGQGSFGHLENYSPQQIVDFFNTNLLSHVLVARNAAPRLKSRGHGDLVFMGSEAALQGAQRGSLYCTAKFGVRGLAQSLRAECSGRGVRVSIINPGLVRSPFFDDLNFRPGADEHNAIEPADVAEAVWMVVSARSGTVFDEVNLSPQKKVIDFGGH
tara:strand:- start:128 stop:838 length:711 start_codon:yes stop_codon:yes gene_type:complete